MWGLGGSDFPIVWLSYSVILIIMSFPIKIEKYHVHKDFRHVQAEWRSLCISAKPSFFLSWEWIENWIRCIPKDISVFLVILSGDEIPKAAFFVGSPPVKIPFVGLKRLYLNSTGIPSIDKLYIEYNTILVENNNQISIDDILSCLPFDWDEFVLPGLDAESFPGDVIESKIYPYNVVMNKVVSPFADLFKVRDNEYDYLSLLSSNTRSQIRRSYRMYQKEGDIELEVAETLEQAINIFAELVNLHQVSWQSRGKQGCFSSDFFLDFHMRLIKKNFLKGTIQLAKLCCGEKAIACLYNFIDNNEVYFYQSGLEVTENNKYKPGLMIHTEMIRYNSKRGLKIYDFLAGSSQYKKSLSTDKKQLIWAKIQKKNMKNAGYNLGKNNYLKIKKKLFR